ncbi:MULTISPECIES: hypothetical protein [Xenorhabdus]|uniref:hypothetical protein n=1 Tax=Xenorhabdus TaxID=626 RepID=UPI00142D954C|nr:MULTISPECIES: hypothetical protein [Xenorhabdus]
MKYFQSNKSPEKLKKVNKNENYFCLLGVLGSIPYDDEVYPMDSEIFGIEI